ncbi:hypothetical protein GCM10027347_12770 [Larkinella harenae]
MDPGAYVLPSQLEQPPRKLAGVYALVGKRFVDLFLTILITLLVLIWLVPLIALAIVLTSPGPAFFVQVRTGRNGRPFRCLKFRTTRHLIPSGLRSVPDSRLRETPVGHWLRASRLDRLPQFAYVLTGDMSIVGPRPQSIQHDAQFWNTPGYRNRHIMSPGIFSLAETRIGQPSESDVRQHLNTIRYDGWYLNRYSFLLDLKICWWAISGSMKSKG